MMRNAVAAGAVLLLGIAASSAVAYPQHVSNTYRVSTNAGESCDVSPVAFAKGSVLGSLEGIEYVDCNVSPYYISLDGGFSNTSLDKLSLFYDPSDGYARCEWSWTCHWSRQRSYFPAGDHYVDHEVIIDLRPETIFTNRWSSYPAACEVAADKGRLICDFRQWVTIPGPASG